MASAAPTPASKTHSVSRLLVGSTRSNTCSMNSAGTRYSRLITNENSARWNNNGFSSVQIGFIFLSPPVCGARRLRALPRPSFQCRSDEVEVVRGYRGIGREGTDQRQFGCRHLTAAGLDPLP